MKNRVISSYQALHDFLYIDKKCKKGAKSGINCYKLPQNYHGKIAINRQKNVVILINYHIL